MVALNGNLNEVQFMPVSEMDNLSSQYPGHTMAQAYTNHQLRFSDRQDNLNAQELGHPDAESYQNALSQHVAEHGIQNPISVRDTFVGNGHHRYFAAKDNGLTHVPVVVRGRAASAPVPGWDD